MSVPTPEEFDSFFKVIGTGTPQDVLTYLKENPSFEIDKLDKDGTSPLVIAVKSRNVPVVRMMLTELKSNPNTVLPQNRSVLHYAAAVEDNVEVIKILLASGAQCNTEPTESGSPLHWACQTNSVLNVAFFLDDLKVPINIRNTSGQTPLFMAANQSQQEVVKFLLERGADLTLSCNEGTTAITYPTIGKENKEATDQEIVKLLCAFDYEGKFGKNTPCNERAMRVEIDRPRLSPGERLDRCERFKAQGNTAFAANEFVKANKFYSFAISFNNTNHVLFSNRSACFFNVGQHRRALADARHCVALNKSWVKGYFRVAAALLALDEYAECDAVIKAGLALDSNNENLKATQVDLRKKLQK